MRTWIRNGYEVREVPFDHDLREFNVVKDNKVVATITPGDLGEMKKIVQALDDGEDVNGWEDGMGNTIRV